MEFAQQMISMTEYVDVDTDCKQCEQTESREVNFFADKVEVMKWKGKSKCALKCVV